MAAPARTTTRLPAAFLLTAAFLLALALPAAAIDLAGKTVRAEGISIRANRSATDKSFTYPLELYFGTKGNRFVTMGATTGDARILVPAGSDRGSARRKDGKFVTIVTLTQSASQLRVKLEGRGATSAQASEGWIFDISLGNGTCQVTKFRYNPDPRQSLSKSVSRSGACTVTSGPPKGLADE